jgi:hypothetical protein
MQIGVLTTHGMPISCASPDSPDLREATGIIKGDIGSG